MATAIEPLQVCSLRRLLGRHIGRSGTHPRNMITEGAGSCLSTTRLQVAFAVSIPKGAGCRSLVTLGFKHGVPSMTLESLVLPAFLLTHEMFYNLGPADSVWTIKMRSSAAVLRQAGLVASLQIDYATNICSGTWNV
jgi:hypothetical protein